MPTSYISEHSAEFTLVPTLKKILKSKFEYVLPLYPWANRETSNISKYLHENDVFYILGLFPRRPKVNQNFKSQIWITINPELIEIHKLGKVRGIPMIVGCPIANNFWELSNCKKHIWLTINESMITDYLLLLPNLPELGNSHGLTNANILDIVDNSCSQHDIYSFNSFIKEARWTGPGYSFWGHRYKPVYFLMKSQ